MKEQSKIQKKAANHFRISIDKLAEMRGESFEELMITCQDSIVPACCSEGCEVEPDGRCEHGCPSAVEALMAI